ncbi:hypothetical protein PAXRUDRAFT_170403, partial [Paxillus rubicundulus Ve08.2h10]
KILEQLHKVLAILMDATTFFLCATPNLVTAIPAMDHIDQQFHEFSCDRKYLAPVCAAGSLTKKTLNHYYSLTDRSKVY